MVDSIARNLFSDLTPLVNRDKGAVQLEDFYPVYVNGMKYQNKLLALPDFTGTSVMFYNKKLLDEAGIKHPGNDFTWDEFEAAGRRLLQRFPEGSSTFLIQPFAEDIRHFPLLAWSGGGAMVEGSGIIPPDKTVARVYSPQNIKQWQRYVDWIQKLHIIARPDETSDWNNERQALVMSTRDSVPGYLNRVPWMMTHAGVALPPKGTAPLRTRATTRASAIPPGVKNRDASWEVVKFMTGKEGLEITMAGGYTQPVRKSVEPAFQRTLAPFEVLPGVPGLAEVLRGRDPLPRPVDRAGAGGEGADPAGGEGGGDRGSGPEGPADAVRAGLQAGRGDLRRQVVFPGGPPLLSGPPAPAYQARAWPSRRGSAPPWRTPACASRAISIALPTASQGPIVCTGWPRRGQRLRQPLREAPLQIEGVRAGVGHGRLGGVLEVAPAGRLHRFGGVEAEVQHGADELQIGLHLGVRPGVPRTRRSSPGSDSSWVVSPGVLSARGEKTIAVFIVWRTRLLGARQSGWSGSRCQ